MRILLTGSSGFIGRNLKDYLCGKYTLLTPSHNELNLIDSDSVESYFKKNEIDFIIHCACVGGARGVADKESTVEENLAMFNHLLAFKKPEVRVILFGSGAMYDKTRNLHKVKESEIGEFVPKDLYGASKLLLAQQIQNRQDTIMLNIFACYGYKEKQNRFPSYAINQALKGEDIVIQQNVVFDYLFVEDMQKIVEYFIQYIPHDKIINITPTLSCTLLDIAKTVKSLSDKNININITNPAMNNEYTGANALLLKNYPNLQFTSLKNGLEKLYHYNQMEATNE